MNIEKLGIGWVNDDFVFDRYTLVGERIHNNHKICYSFKFYPKSGEICTYSETDEGIIEKPIDSETKEFLLDFENTEWYGFNGKLNGLTLRKAIELWPKKP